MLHHTLYPCGTFASFKDNIGLVFCIIAVFLIERIKDLEKRESHFAVIGCCFGYKHSGAYAVLVADVRAGAVADGFLISEKIFLVFFFYERDKAADVFESGKRFVHFNAI